MATNMFISYRRHQEAGVAGRVSDRLAQEFGRDSLFMDVDSIPYGINFVNTLDGEVAKCDVLLAIIGSDWLDACDEKGNRQLDNPHDFVRIEIAAALKRNIPVVPIMVDGTRIPKADELPDNLKDLAVRNVINVRHDSFHSDMDRLVRNLKEQFGRSGAPPTAVHGDERHRREAEAVRQVRQEEQRGAATQPSLGRYFAGAALAGIIIAMILAPMFGVLPSEYFQVIPFLSLLLTFLLFPTLLFFRWLIRRKTPAG